jgi:hypothetical protein
MVQSYSVIFAAGATIVSIKRSMAFPNRDRRIMNTILKIAPKT